MLEFSFWYVVFVGVKYGLCECFVGCMYVRDVICYRQSLFYVISETVPVCFFVVGVAVPVLGLSEVGSGIVGDFYGEMV